MSIQQYLDKIKNAVYGREVRGAIHDAIKQTYDDASRGGNANMEVSLARGGFRTLNERLTNADQQLAQKFDQVSFDLSSQKINFYSNGRLKNSVDISEASNAQAVQEYIDTLVSDGAIEGVVLGNESVGTLQLSYKSVTNEKIAVAKVGKNLFDKSRVTNVLLSRTTGEEFPNDDYYSSDYIPIKPNTTYARRYQSRVIFYNSKVEFLEGTGEENPSAEINVPGTPVTSPEGARYARISFRSSDPRMLNQFTFEEGDEISTFEPHYHELKNTAASDISRFRASDTSFEYDDAGNLKRVIEGGITTNFFYSNGEITHIITTDSELGTQKRTDFIMEDGTVKEITERFV